MNNIDAIYYINLDHRPDRKESITSQLQPYNHPNIIRTPGVISKFGALGCGYAHINCIKHFIESKHNTCLILEDDFEFVRTPNEVNSILQRFFELNVAFDVLLLAGVARSLQPSHLPFVAKVIDVQTTSAYVLTKHYAKTLLANFTEAMNLLAQHDKPIGRLCIDIYWKQLQPRHKWYITNPKLGRQLLNNYSDNERRVVAYSENLNAIVQPLPLTTFIFVNIPDFATFTNDKYKQCLTQLKLQHNKLCALYCVYYDATKPTTYFHINEQYKYIIFGKKIENGLQLMILLKLCMSYLTYASKFLFTTYDELYRTFNFDQSSNEITFYTKNSFCIGIDNIKPILEDEKSFIIQPLQHIMNVTNTHHDVEVTKPDVVPSTPTKYVDKVEPKPQPQTEPFVKPKIDNFGEITMTTPNVEFMLNSIMYSITKSINNHYGTINAEFSNQLHTSVYDTVNVALNKITKMNQKKQLRLTRN